MVLVIVASTPASLLLVLLEGVQTSYSPLVACTALLTTTSTTPHAYRGDRYTDSGQAPYGTSKAYIIMFSRELAQRLGDRRIKVFAVQPGVPGEGGEGGVHAHRQVD
jgi:NAD(P)-dependent dehydrogenase (short-subunit alcohol dehydrogenase family)